MDSDVRSELLEMVEQMPAFPQSVSRVIELTSDIDCPPKELVRVIEHDPVMTMKMLKLVGSAYFGLKRPISSINHAIVYLGLNTVKNMAISIATVGMLQRFDSPRFNTDDFLLHSLVTAAIARRLSEGIDRQGRDATDFFIAGLLHDFGKMVLIQFMQEEFFDALTLADDAKLPLQQAERQVLGIDHAEVGALLAEHWKLDTALIDCIRDHHRMQGEGSALTDCVFAADQITKRAAIGHAGNRVVEPFPERVVTRLGMDLEQLAAELGDLKQEEEKARLFMHL